LEILAEKLGGRLCSAAFAPAAPPRRSAMRASPLPLWLALFLERTHALVLIGRPQRLDDGRRAGRASC
jgi:hypothetical protein